MISKFPGIFNRSHIQASGKKIDNMCKFVTNRSLFSIRLSASVHDNQRSTRTSLKTPLLITAKWSITQICTQLRDHIAFIGSTVIT